MANEIAILDGDGGLNFGLLFLFPIATPKQVNGANVVPTPSITLTSAGTLVLTAIEKQALDAGTSAFRILTFRKDPAFTAAQLSARVKAIYTAQLTDFTTWYTEKYRHIGTRIDAP